MSLPIFTLRNIFSDAFIGKSGIDYEALCDIIAIDDTFNTDAYAYDESIESKNKAIMNYVGAGNGQFVLYERTTSPAGDDVWSEIHDPDTFIATSTELYLKKTTDEEEYVHIYTLIHLDMEKIISKNNGMLCNPYSDIAMRAMAILYAMACFQKKLVTLQIYDVEAINNAQREINRISTMLATAQSDVTEKDAAITETKFAHTVKLGADVIAYFVLHHLFETTMMGSSSLQLKMGSGQVAIMENILVGNEINVQKSVTAYKLVSVSTRDVSTTYTHFIDALRLKNVAEIANAKACGDELYETIKEYIDKYENFNNCNFNSISNTEEKVKLIMDFLGLNVIGDGIIKDGVIGGGSEVDTATIIKVPLCWRSIEVPEEVPETEEGEENSEANEEAEEGEEEEVKMKTVIVIPTLAELTHDELNKVYTQIKSSENLVQIKFGTVNVDVESGGGGDEETEGEAQQQQEWSLYFNKEVPETVDLDKFYWPNFTKFYNVLTRYVAEAEGTKPLGNGAPTGFTLQELKDAFSAITLQSFYIKGGEIETLNVSKTGAQSLSALSSFKAYAMLRGLICYNKPLLSGKWTIPSTYGSKIKSGDVLMDVFDRHYWREIVDANGSAFKGTVGIGNHYVLDPRIRNKGGEILNKEGGVWKETDGIEKCAYFEGFNSVTIRGGYGENREAIYDKAAGCVFSSIPNQAEQSVDLSVSWYEKNPPSNPEEFQRGCTGLLAKTYGGKYFMPGVSKYFDSNTKLFTATFKNALASDSTQMKVIWRPNSGGSYGFYISQFGSETLANSGGEETGAVTLGALRQNAQSASQEDLWNIPKKNPIGNNQTIYSGAYYQSLINPINSEVVDGGGVAYSGQQLSILIDSLRILVDTVNNTLSGVTTRMQGNLQAQQQTVNLSTNLAKNVFRMRSEMSGNIR
ncbi:MAG: hypothetical protein LBI69_04275 [Puniceicoccales bacterium]|jgi:hypothetical protein|nr:hypothetical protein [Puniceicoccales bacterium]